MSQIKHHVNMPTQSLSLWSRSWSWIANYTLRSIPKLLPVYHSREPQPKKLYFEDYVRLPQLAREAGGLCVQQIRNDYLIRKEGIQKASIEYKSQSRYKNQTQKPDMLLCPICLQLFSGPVTTSCCHTFCQMCLDEAILFNPSCPVCRSIIRGEELIISKTLEKLILMILLKLEVQQVDKFVKKQIQYRQWCKSRTICKETLEIGQHIDVRDTEFVWCRATVADILYSANSNCNSNFSQQQSTSFSQILVHYQGWASIYDQIIHIDSQRLANQRFYTCRTQIPHYNLSQDNREHIRSTVITGQIPVLQAADFQNPPYYDTQEEISRLSQVSQHASGQSSSSSSNESPYQSQLQNSFQLNHQSMSNSYQFNHHTLIPLHRRHDNFLQQQQLNDIDIEYREHYQFMNTMRRNSSISGLSNIEEYQHSICDQIYNKIYEDDYQIFSNHWNKDESYNLIQWEQHVPRAHSVGCIIELRYLLNLNQEKQQDQIIVDYPEHLHNITMPQIRMRDSKSSQCQRNRQHANRYGQQAQTIIQDKRILYNTLAYHENDQQPIRNIKLIQSQHNRLINRISKTLDRRGSNSNSNSNNNNNCQKQQFQGNNDGSDNKILFLQENDDNFYQKIQLLIGEYQKENQVKYKQEMDSKEIGLDVREKQINNNIHHNHHQKHHHRNNQDQNHHNSRQHASSHQQTKQNKQSLKDIQQKQKINSSELKDIQQKQKFNSSKSQQDKYNPENLQQNKSNTKTYQQLNNDISIELQQLLLSRESQLKLIAQWIAK